MNSSEKEMMKIIKKNNRLQNKTKMVLKMQTKRINKVQFNGETKTNQLKITSMKTPKQNNLF